MGGRIFRDFSRENDYTIIDDIIIGGISPDRAFMRLRERRLEGPSHFFIFTLVKDGEDLGNFIGVMICTTSGQ